MRKIFSQLNSSRLCFLSGDLLSTSFYLLFGSEITHFMLKAFGTLIIGIIGGLAGLAGKDLYPILKQFIKSKIFKQKQS